MNKPDNLESSFPTPPSGGRGVLQDLISISHYYGTDKRFVIAGGGATSYKNAERIWVKAGGTMLATITEGGFVEMDRAKLSQMTAKTYSANPALREQELKIDLEAASITRGMNPSVESAIHNQIDYAYVVHLHPMLVNALMCSQNAETELAGLFGDKMVYIPYTEPGYQLFRRAEEAIKAYRAENVAEPSILWLQNHGIYVAANTVDEIKYLYAKITETIDRHIVMPLPSGDEPVGSFADQVLPALRMMLSSDGLKTLKVRNNALINHFCESPVEQANIARPLTPDGIAYCKANYIFLNEDEPEALVAASQKAIDAFHKRFGGYPRVLLLKGIGLVAAGDNAADCEAILDIFEDAMKVVWLSASFGGVHPMNPLAVDSFEKQLVAKPALSVHGRAENKTIVVTGAAQGFGEGIARCLLQQGANIVVADMNETAGLATVEGFNQITGNNRAIFVKTDVSGIASIENLMRETICHFGGIDCFISNAGVLRAGGLEDMTPEDFEFVTKINYNAYFYCTKVVSRVMKLQTQYAAPDYYADIIQINSKSGLRGSKANFAYAGGKFGGVGLTQSFALELAPFRIKVNSVCPGNFYEGLLWSDPENGLFVQYLRAGKVPGAKTIEDVKEFYLAQVPMKKGCSPEDVTKGVLYLMEQCGETGQALPITGGQVMLS